MAIKIKVLAFIGRGELHRIINCIKHDQMRLLGVISRLVIIRLESLISVSSGRRFIIVISLALVSWWLPAIFARVPYLPQDPQLLVPRYRQFSSV